MIRYLAACLFVLLGSSTAALASQVSIATWNLGWHMDLQTSEHWINECSKNYVEDPATGKFKPSQEAGFKPGWDIDAFKIDGWDVSRLPVCNVYFAGGSVRVNLEAYRKRQEQIANFISRSVPADNIAFQEVSGEQAIREVLPNGGADYDFCPVTGYKVQPNEKEEIFFGAGALRFAKTIGNKLDRRYDHLPHVVGKPFILAVADFQSSGSMTWSREGLLGYLQGSGATVAEINGRLQAVPMPAETLLGPSQFPAGLFADDRHAELSAVIFSNACSIAKLSRVPISANGAPKGYQDGRVL